VTSTPSTPIVSADDPVFDPADMDTSETPMTDFWRFANGGWIDANPVPPEYAAWGAFHELQTRNEDILHTLLEQAVTEGGPAGSPSRVSGDFFASGMDTDAVEALGIEPIQQWLDLIDSIGNEADLRASFASLMPIGVGIGWSWMVEPDRSDTTRNLLYVGQGGIGLPDRDYYFRDDKQSMELAEAYRTHAAAMFELLGRSKDEAAEASQTIWDIELRLAEASYTAVQQRDVELTTNMYTRAELAKLSPATDLNAWIDTIGAGDEINVNIDNPGFFSALDEMMGDISIDDWKTYITWHLVTSTASSLPSRFEDEAFSFWGTKVAGQKVQKERWKRVLAVAGGSIGHLVSQLYVKDNFPPESKVRMEDLVDKILVQMRHSIETADWMGDDTKTQALRKLDGFGYKIGYPDEWRDYSALTISDTGWLANRLAARTFEFNRNIGLLGKPIDPHEWLLPPHIVNAYYWPERNEIVFPAGILQDPFFVGDADDAVNFGAIGVVIGHEITHGFDDKGSLFDADGHLRNWWDDTDRQEFESRAQVISEQFSGYEVEEGLNVNGDLTLGENIADLAGLTLAIAALKDIVAKDGDPEVGGLSAEQRFFLSYARVWRGNTTPEYLRLIVNSDPHSPGEFRVRGPLSNLREFAEAFDIPDDAPTMRPVEMRAKVW
jgi:putative endopeptidase